MKIIKYNLLNSTNSINAISINLNEQFIAFGDSNKEITIFNYQSLKVYLQTQPISSNITTTETLTSYFLEGLHVPKITIEFHTEQVNSLCFSHTNPELLLSASQDRTIALWRILISPFDKTRQKVIKLASPITDMCLYPDDSHIVVSAIDNIVYILKCNLDEKSIETVNAITVHDNIVTSLTLDPEVLRTGRFASLSDKGRLVISAYYPKENTVTIVKDYAELVNINHKCTIQQKKIDWSADGKWIISVDHHMIRKQSILHGRLVNMDMLDVDSQILIGHDSPVLIGRFSRCLYNFKGSDAQFQLLATSDKNGSLFIWRIDQEKFRIMTEIGSFSESNVTDMHWCSSGEYLFVANSTGTVTVVYFNEFDIKVLKERKSVSALGFNLAVDLNSNLTSIGNKRKINPTMINECMPSQLQQHPMIMQQQQPLMTQQQQQLLPQTMINCQRCQRQSHQVLENKLIKIPLTFYFNNIPVIFTYSNNPYENSSTISLTINNSSNNNNNITNNNHRLLYANKYHNQMIKLFTANNFFFAFYDTDFTLNISTFFNTSLQTHLYIEEVSIIEPYLQYLLILTTQNRLIILDILTNTTKVDKVLLINTDVHNVFQTKINKVDFVDLDTIVIEADTVNVYKNCNVKMTLLFNVSNHQMTMTRNEEECKGMIEEGKEKMRKVRSCYNEYVEGEWDKEYSSAEKEHYEANSEVMCYEEKMRDALYFGKKDEAIVMLRKIIAVINGKGFMKYRMFDLIQGGIVVEMKNDIEMIMKEMMDAKMKINGKDQRMDIDEEGDGDVRMEENVDELQLQQEQRQILPERDITKNDNNNNP